MSSKWFGHELESVGIDKWIYKDTGEIGDCKSLRTWCGHGDIRQAYIQYWDRTRIDGEEAIKRQKELKENK